MLSLPRKLIFGSQDKFDFKLDQLDGIARLYSERHIPYHDSKYWSRYLQLDSPTDVFSLLSLADLRRARKHAPENVVTLVRVMVAHLQSLLVDPLFEPPPTLNKDAPTSRLNGLADVSKWKVPGASLMGFDSGQAATGSVERDRTKEALNVVRILTRTLPAVMESEDAEFENEVLWRQAPEAYAEVGSDSKHSTSSTTAISGAEAGLGANDAKLDTSAQFVIDDEQDDDDDDTQAAKQSSDQTEALYHPLSSPDKPDQAAEPHDDEPIPVALGERLVQLVIDLLFCSGFTLPWADDQLQEPTPQRINYSIWEAGVGSSVDLPSTTRFHVSNRVEVLRLLLVLLSKSIYIPAHRQNSQVDPALKFAVQDLDRSVMLPLLCSLMNTSITNAKNSTGGWLGIPSGLVGGGSNDEVRNGLVTTSLQILDVLLTYDAPVPGGADTVSLSTVGRPAPGPGGGNVFRFYLSKLHRTADFEFIWTGLARSFNEHVNSTIQILAIPIPTGGQGRRAAETSWQLNQVAERLILLWRLLECNSKFRMYVLDDARRAPEVLTVLLYFALTYKDNVALGGLVRLCAFILQDVSSERCFAVQLAKVGSASKVHLPNRLGLVGGNTAVDFLIQAVYSLIATTQGQLVSLYAPLVLSLSNTAPEWRAVSITASSRVIQLLRAFAQPSFLLSEEGNPRLLYYVLEAINAVLTCGWERNVNLVYSLVLARGVVEGLEGFELRRGVEEVWRRRRRVGMETRDWFEELDLEQEGRAEKVPLPTETQAASSGDAKENDEDGEKAVSGAVDKGKMRRISTSSLESAYQGELSKYTLESVESVAAAYIGKHGFRPTQAWVSSWHSALPLSTPRLVIDRLLPEIERIAAGTTAEITGGDTDARVLAYLREQQSDYLPPPQGGFHARGWHWTDQASVWLKSYLWGCIYVSGLLPWGVWSETEVRLFRIHGAREQADEGSAGQT